MRPLDEKYTKISEFIERENPEYYYEGGIPEDQDLLDYIKVPIKGHRVG